MLKLENIVHRFGSRVVLDIASCSVEKGDFVVIVGENGAGKTSFFDIITGRIRPVGSTITLDGIDLFSKNERERALLVGRLFQDPAFNCVLDMTVVENIAIALYKGSPVGLSSGISKEAHLKLSEIATLLNLDPCELEKKRMASLSGGQRQTIALLMATLVKPKLLLLDEATAALDPRAATKLLSFIATYVKEHKITTIMITHDPQLALSLGNKIWVLQEGRITKKFGQREKAHLEASDLIGHIEYEKIGRCY